MKVKDCRWAINVEITSYKFYVRIGLKLFLGLSIRSKLCINWVVLNCYKILGVVK